MNHIRVDRRTWLLAAAAAIVLGLPVEARASGRYFSHGRGSSYSTYSRINSYGIWRYHGLGFPSTCYSGGVRRFHGLGDGYWYRFSRRLHHPYYGPHVVIIQPPAPVFRQGPPIFLELPLPIEPPASTQPQTPPASPPAQGMNLNTNRSPQRGWEHLRRGDAHAALREFAVLALRFKNEAQPRVGFALAAAVLDQTDTAVWSMRQAIMADAEALGSLQFDERLQSVIRELIEGYGSGQAHPRDGDTLFMMAALYFLLGETAEARVALNAAGTPGDRDQSFLRLEEVLTPDDRQTSPVPEHVDQIATNST